MRNLKSLLAILSAILISSCAAYSGYGLKPGVATLDDIVRVMGEPAMRWQDPDHSVQLAYPRGPSGFHTYMVFVAADGKLRRIENVMDPQAFARIRPGMTEDEVLRTLGPPPPGWKTYHRDRDEMEWEWRYCDEWNKAARFDVLFDHTRGTVRSATAWPGDHFGFCPRWGCGCSH